MSSNDLSATIRQSVEQAAAEKTPLNIVAGGSKGFFGRQATGRPLQVDGHRGIVNYQPSELVVTARAGTPLAEIVELLAGQRQMLPFEPPAFGERATLGGTIACALSGSRRPYAGSARDCVLGCRIVDGKGDILSFGGEVMKNVAGYDVSRLMVGAMGTLGLLLEISIKVLPMPQRETTRSFDLDQEQAMESMSRLASRSLPLSALSYDGKRLFVRLSGAEMAVRAAAEKIGGDDVQESDAYWRRLNEQQLPFFSDGRPLWRLSMPPAAMQPNVAGEWYLDWGGALRWLKSEEPAEKIFAAASAGDGHAALFRGGDRNGNVFMPAGGKLLQLQRNLKQVFDPQGILNSRRMYKDW